MSLECSTDPDKTSSDFYTYFEVRQSGALTPQSIGGTALLSQNFVDFDKLLFVCSVYETYAEAATLPQQCTLLYIHSV